MEIIEESKYTIILSEYELRILYTAMRDFSKNKSNIEITMAEDIYCALF